MKDIYVKFEGAAELQGDSTDTKHANEIEVTSFKHFVRQPKSSSASSAGAHTAERTEHGEMLFQKDIDRASSKLFRAASAGTVYPKVLITFYRAYGGKSATRPRSRASTTTRSCWKTSPCRPSKPSSVKASCRLKPSA